jgi:hypothetical protein
MHGELLSQKACITFQLILHKALISGKSFIEACLAAGVDLNILYGKGMIESYFNGLLPAAKNLMKPLNEGLFVSTHSDRYKHPILFGAIWGCLLDFLHNVSKLSCRYKTKQLHVEPRGLRWGGRFDDLGAAEPKTA